MVKFPTTGNGGRSKERWRCRDSDGAISTGRPSAGAPASLYQQQAPQAQHRRDGDASACPPHRGSTNAAAPVDGAPVTDVQRRRQGLRRNAWLGPDLHHLHHRGAVVRPRPRLAARGRHGEHGNEQAQAHGHPEQRRRSRLPPHDRPVPAHAQERRTARSRKATTICMRSPHRSSNRCAAPSRTATPICCASQAPGSSLLRCSRFSATSASMKTVDRTVCRPAHPPAIRPPHMEPLDASASEPTSSSEPNACLGAVPCVSQAA
jgi:hypothetical protein